MKKIIVIGIVIILLGLTGYIFIAKKSANRESLQPTPQMIDTNDNLDQALQDLDQVE